MIRLPAPRLLPVTIATISVLLVVKSGVLLQAALTDGRHPEAAMVAAANAASADKEHAKPAPGNSPPLSPPPADPSRGDPAHPITATGASPEAASRASTSPQPEIPTASEGRAPVSDSERAILQELRQRRKEIDTRESTVSARESVLSAAEQKLAVRVSELQALQHKLEGLDVAQKQKEDAGWQAMVKLYEAMKPKEAAAIFNELSMPVLLQLLDRMKDSKAAAVMAAMGPDKARDVTSELAQMRTGHDASSTPGLGMKPNPLGG